MNPWKWIRARKWWVQLLVALVVVPLALASLYVAGRSLQYASAERDAGVYVPATANVVVRARDLEGHLRRIRESAGWRALQRKFLKDPILRREINDLLKANGAPTLDDLEDERKPIARYQETALHALGSDAIATLQVREALPTAHFCAIVRLRWLHYLAAPFARLALPKETIGGESCLVVNQGRQQIRVAFVGSLAIASSDPALLEQALLRKGRQEESPRPVEGRVVFEGSPGLLKIRKAAQDSGLFPYVKWPTARGAEFSVDLRDATMVVDAKFDRAEPLHPSAPPMMILSWAPLDSSGMMITNTGAQDLINWARSLIVPGSRDVLSENLQGALQALDDGGLTSKVLPLTQDGMGVLTGVTVDEKARVIPTLALVLPSNDAPAVIATLNDLVRKIAGSYGDSKYFRDEPVGESTLYSWGWPDGLQIASLLQPSYAAVKGMVVVGTNRQFVRQLIQAAEQGDGIEQTSTFRKLRSRLKELGMSTDPSVAGGFLFPPQLRDALTGSLSHVAKLTMPPVNGAALNAEVVASLSRGGRTPTAEEINKAYNEAIDQKVADEEASLRRLLAPLDAIKWMAYDAQADPKGIAFKFALEFR
jgi:hypothetical protein